MPQPKVGGQSVRPVPSSGWKKQWREPGWRPHLSPVLAVVTMGSWAMCKLWLCRALQSIITTAQHVQNMHKGPILAGSWFLLSTSVFINFQPIRFLLAPFFSASKKFTLNHSVLFPLVKIKVNEIPATASQIQLCIYQRFYTACYTA